MNHDNKPAHAHDPEDLVSIIIPSYNAAPFIKETLESVFAQTYTNYQVIVVNDGSPDTPVFEAILSPWMDRITYVKQENRGLSGARNAGLRAAKGNLVALLDADDIWMPDYLEAQTAYLREHPECDLVYCNCMFFGDSIHSGTDFMASFPSNGEATPAAIISRRVHIFVSVMARTNALKSIGFDESLRSCEDFDCWIRFTAAGYKIGYHRKILIRYRKHAASLSASSTRMAESNIQVLTKSLSLWPADSEENRLLLEARARKVAELETIRGKLALESGNPQAAIDHLLAANAFHKSYKKAAIIFLLKLAPAPIALVVKLRRSLFRAYREH